LEVSRTADEWVEVDRWLKFDSEAEGLMSSVLVL
jgi:hypothetical protein